jgi:hypothetical protein
MPLGVCLFLWCLCKLCRNLAAHWTWLLTLNLTTSLTLIDSNTPLTSDDPVVSITIEDPPVSIAVDDPPVSTGDDQPVSTEVATSSLLAADPSSQHHHHTRSSNKRTSFSCLSTSSAKVSKAAKVASSDDPTLGQALKGDDADNWKLAIKSEISSLLSHDIGSPVLRSEIPAGEQILPVKCVLHIKRDSKSDPIKFKARLVVLGNLKKNTMSDVFAPTANDKSIKLLLSLATSLGLIVISTDVFGAFLYPTQEEPIYIVLPSKITGDELVYWKLNKTMYGLPSSPAAFYKHVSGHLLKSGYTRCQSDPCFFYKRTSDQMLLAVIHVDDFVVASSCADMIDDFIIMLRLVYVVTVSDKVDHFLGIHIESQPDGSRLLS